MGTQGWAKKSAVWFLLTAENDDKKFGIKIVYRAWENQSRLRLTVVSGCHKVPEGEKIERY
ncbi:hypothetical protein FNV64_33505 [Streptomyces sp. S1A1-7]|uniref:hypothetical protein n=1 Tax=Streptomyces sp. S1A1-7 TaxID=2594459 RepID=UPI001162FE15|nr:hypothetical protein [Streptomyces sp. S1A1-7]QDN79829.1 hypothetical protein FNV64_33505 [Streptomyces sp. S1A1-7]